VEKAILSAGHLTADARPPDVWRASLSITFRKHLGRYLEFRRLL